MDSYHYEWRLLHDGIGRVPNVRYDAASFFYNNCLWVTCGGGSGLGKSSEVWKFDTTTKLWSKIDIPANECPTGRDSHSGTYIGNGKFVIFGGQGFSEPNKKLGKESDQLRAQTHCKRDVFNDLWVFDCNTLKWTPIYPDGLNFPMGRRGHSAIYIPKNTLAREEEERARLLKKQQRHPAAHHHHHNRHNDEASSAPSQSSFGTSLASSMASLKHNHLNNSQHAEHSAPGSRGTPSRSALRHGKDGGGETIYEAIPENSLVIYGGAGIELSKYTEQLYNDVWVYSFESNTWHKHETRGMEPRPTVNHRVIRSGENMLIIGGIVGQPPELPGITNNNQHSPPSSAGGDHNNNNNNLNNSGLDGDLQVLNLRTVTWSVLRVLDHAGRPTKIGSLGFSVVPDVDLATEDMTYLPPTSILVFGGKENVDSKLASTTKQTKRQQMIATSSLPANARRLSAAQKRMIENISEKTYAHFHADGDLLDPWSVTDDQLMLLDIQQCTLTILQTRNDGALSLPPEGRYAHIAVGANPPKEYALEQEKEAQEALVAQNSSSGPNKYGNRTARHGGGGGGATTRRGNNMTSSRSYGTTTSRSAGGDSSSFLPETPVMYVFGGCRLENNGYCDPAVYALVKVYPPTEGAGKGQHSTMTTERSNSNYSTSPSPTQTGRLAALNMPIATQRTARTFDSTMTAGSGSPFANSGGGGAAAAATDDDFSRVSQNDLPSPFFALDVGRGRGGRSGLDSPMGDGLDGLPMSSSSSSPMHAPRGGGDMLEQSTYSAVGRSAGNNHNNTSSSSMVQSSTQQMMMDLLSAHPSIWMNLQKKEQLNDRSHETQLPMNWDEMKLSLTASRSLRIVHGQVLGGSQQETSSFSAVSPMGSPVMMSGAGFSSSSVLSPTGKPHSGSGTMHPSVSAPSLSTVLPPEFAFRSVASFNRGAPCSPFNENPGGLNSPRRASSSRGVHRGYSGGSSAQHNNQQEFVRSAPGSAGTWAHPQTSSSGRGSGSGGGGGVGRNSSSSGMQQLNNSMSALTLSSTHDRFMSQPLPQKKPQSAQSRALAEEARKERILHIKKTLKPIVTKQTKTIARETYKQLFPPPSDVL